MSGWYKVEPCQVRCLLPHEILHSLATMSCTSVLSSTMLGNQSETVRCQFWEHVRQLKPWSSHPVLHGPDYDPRKLVGFCIHGDGCQMFKDDEVFVWSVSSIFAQEGLIGDVLAFKYPFMAIPGKFMRSPTAPWLTCVYRAPSHVWFNIPLYVGRPSHSQGSKRGGENSCEVGCLVDLVELERYRASSWVRWLGISTSLHPFQNEGPKLGKRMEETRCNWFNFPPGKPKVKMEYPKNH